MKKFLSITFLLLIALPLVAYAFISVPVGGKVLTTKPCDEGLLLTVKTSKGVAPYIWIWGNLPYLSRRPPHVNQNILGIAKSVPIPCTVSGVPYTGGLPILFHGSSY